MPREAVKLGCMKLGSSVGHLLDVARVQGFFWQARSTAWQNGLRISAGKGLVMTPKGALTWASPMSTGYCF